MVVGQKLNPSNKSWYKLWSEIPLVRGHIIEANLAKLDKISEEIGLGNAVFASSAMAQIEYASEDPRIPPKLSFEGVLPILKNEVIEIFNKAAGKVWFSTLPLENFDKALVALAFKGVRAVPTPAFLSVVVIVLYHHEPHFLTLLDHLHGQNLLDFHSVTGWNTP